MTGGRPSRRCAAAGGDKRSCGCPFHCPADRHVRFPDQGLAPIVALNSKPPRRGRDEEPLPHRPVSHDVRRPAPAWRQRTGYPGAVHSQRPAAAKQATTTIPIVMADVGDAVAYGLVVSLARPGGNITGQSFFAPQLGVKRIELLKEVLPWMTRVAYLFNPDNPSTYASDLDPGSWQPTITSRSGGYCQVNGLPVPRQEIRYLICGIVRQPGQHVGEPSLWIDIIELACRNQGIDGGCASYAGDWVTRSIRRRGEPAFR